MDGAFLVPKKEVAQVAPKGSSKPGTNEHFEEYLVKHFKHTNGGLDDNLDQIHKDYSKKYGWINFKDYTSELIKTIQGLYADYNRKTLNKVIKIINFVEDTEL